MAVNNPRFPHYCRILRKMTRTPLEDIDDFSPLNSDLREIEEEGCGCVGCTSTILQTHENPESGCVTMTIYEGACRSYDKHTTSDRGEVITSYRGLALPFTQDDWSSLGYIPREGDEVAVDRGSHQEYGRVIDINAANFHGTHITWRYGRN